MNPTACPPPGETHPAYAEYEATIRRWLADDGWQPLRIAFFRPIHIGYWETEPEPPMTAEPRAVIQTLEKRWAAGPAPYVGHPFVYRWRVAVDGIGRMVAAEAEIQPVGGPWCEAPDCPDEAGWRFEAAADGRFAGRHRRAGDPILLCFAHGRDLRDAQTAWHDWELPGWLRGTGLAFLPRVPRP